jgi:hypothetical protein
MNGHWEPVFFKGEPTWVEDETLIGLDDEELKLLGYRDRFLRDSDGRRIQHRIHHPPPTQLQMFIAERQFPKLYGPTPSTLNINSRSASTAVIRHTLPSPPAPVEVLPALKPAAIAAPVTHADDDLDLGLDEPIAEPAPMVSEPEPEPPSKPVGQPGKVLTPLQQDLLARLKASQSRPPAARPTPAGPAPVRRVGLTSVGRDEDDDRNPNRVGSGPLNSPPGAIKLA